MQTMRVAFGDLIYGDFPYEEIPGEKRRWLFVLRDMEDKVLVLYCTSNPDPRHPAVRLGMLEDHKVTNLVPMRWEVIQKARIAKSKGLQRIEFAHVLPYIGRASKLGVYAEFSAWVGEEVTRQVGYAEIRAQKRRSR